MAINPNQINLIDFNGLSVAFNPTLGWVLAIQDPNGTIINQVSLQTIANLIAGNISLPNGVISGLELSFNNGTTPKTVSISEGQWRIANTVYQSNTPEVYNINPASLTDRTDAILADDSGLVYYQPNFNGTIPNAAILVSTFLVPADGGDIEPVNTDPVIYAVMNGLNTGDLNITGRFLVNGLPINSGGGSAALTFTIEVDENGFVDLSGQTGMPAAGTIPSGLRVYSDDADYSQSASYTPSNQMVFTGLEEGTATTIKITF